MNRSEALIARIKALIDAYEPEDRTVAGAIRQAISSARELHNNPEVARIAGLGASHPDRISKAEIQTLCAAVMRHIERAEDNR